jgi:DNA-directed RNA polymerase subunit RPC12/RpoP
MNPSKEERTEALYWLSSIAGDPVRERELLNMILVDEPNEPRAYRRLLMLDGKLQSEDLINPETYAQDTGTTITVSPDRFTCPKCGGRLTYTPDGTSLECEYCTTRQSFKPKSGRPSDEELSGNDFIAAMATANGHNRAVEHQLLTCEGCGAEFLIDDRQFSAICPFCDSPLVIDVRVIRQMIPPSRVIPLEISLSVAHNSVEKQLPGELSLDNIDEIRPGFYPVWEFEMNGHVIWRLPVSILSEDMEQKSFEVQVQSRVVQVMAFDGFLSNINDLENDFDFALVQPYTPTYLVDSLGVGYNIPVSYAALQAREKMVKTIKDEVRSRMGPLMNGYLIDSSGLFISRFWLTLVPLWAFPHKKSGEVTFVNGQTGSIRTGKITGNEK